MYLPAKTTLIARSLFSFLVILAASSTVKAGVYMDLGDVPGASKESKHTNWITVQAAQFSVSRPKSQDSNARSGSSRPNFSEITLVRQTDVSSADLFIRAANGDTEKAAVIEFTNSTGFVYLRVELKRVAVTSYSVSASDGAISEEIRVTFSEIRMTFNAMDDGGESDASFTRTWSVERNEEV